MPQELVDLCFLMYFFVLDEWDENLMTDGMISDTKTRAAMTTDCDVYWMDAFRTIVIERGDVQIWEVKGCQSNQIDNYVIVGVVDDEAKKKKMSKFLCK